MTYNDKKIWGNFPPIIGKEIEFLYNDNKIYRGIVNNLYSNYADIYNNQIGNYQLYPNTRFWYTNIPSRGIIDLNLRTDDINFYTQEQFNKNPNLFTQNMQSINNFNPNQFSQNYNNQSFSNSNYPNNFISTTKKYNNPIYKLQNYMFGNPNKRDLYYDDYKQYINNLPTEYSLSIQNMDEYSYLDAIELLYKYVENDLNNLKKITSTNLREKPILFNNKEYIIYIPSNINYVEINKQLVNETNIIGKTEIVNTNLRNVDNKVISYIEKELDEANGIKYYLNNFLYKTDETQLGINTYFKFLFHDLIYVHYKGFVCISRFGLLYEIPDNLNWIRKQDFNILLKEHIPHINNVEFLNKPINYKDIINSNLSLEEKKEILSLEYCIALQSQPEYQLYILRRLLIAWYSDDELTLGITMIRITIDQFRCKRTPENMALDVLPSILIYCKYGKRNFDIVKNKINYYFSNFKQLGRINDDPDYFTKDNDLIYWSNGSLELKRYLDKTNNLDYYDKQNISDRTNISNIPLSDGTPRRGDIKEIEKELDENKYKSKEKN